MKRITIYVCLITVTTLFHLFRRFLALLKKEICQSTVNLWETSSHKFISGGPPLG